MRKASSSDAAYIRKVTKRYAAVRQSRKGSARIMTFLPILISIGALAISLFALLEQSNADLAAATAAKQAYADQASYWVVPLANKPYSPVLYIQNRSPAPIAQVILEITSAQANVPNASYGDSIGVGVIPPCSIVRANIQPQLVKIADAVKATPGYQPKAGELRTVISSMVFTDATDRTWERSSTGGLAAVPSSQHYSGVVYYPLLGRSNVITVGGCP